MAFFGRNSLFLSLILLLFIGVVAGPLSTEIHAQDAAEEEAMPYIADDDEMEDDEEEATPQIAEDNEPEADEDNEATTGANNGSDPATGESGGLMAWLNDNLQLVGGILCALVMLPILMKLAAKRNAGAPSIGEGALPVSTPADPLVLDEHQSFTNEGLVSPIEDLDQDGTLNPEMSGALEHAQQYAGSDLPPGAEGYPSIPTPPPIATPPVTGQISEGDFPYGGLKPEETVDTNIEQYTGSDVPPGAPNYPSIPDAPMTIVDEASDKADFPYGGHTSSGASADDDSIELAGDIDAVELTDDPTGDFEDVFEVEAKEQPNQPAEPAKEDDDIDAFEAANANDPFEVEDETASEAAEKVAALADNELVLAPSETADSEDEMAAAKISDEFGDAEDTNDESTPEPSPTADVAVAAGAGATAAAATVAAQNGIAEMRVAAIQEALSQEQQQVTKLTAESDNLKKLVQRLEQELTVEKKRAASAAASSAAVRASSNPSDLDIEALIKLQEENRELSLRLNEEVAKSKQNDSQLKTLETSVKALDARLSLVNTERDNLARMLYDAKQQARKPR